MPDSAAASRARYALQTLIAELAGHRQASSETGYDAHTQIDPHSAPTSAVQVQTTPMGQEATNIGLANTQALAAIDPTTAISRKLDILLVDASLRLQAQLEADPNQQYPSNVATMGTINRIPNVSEPQMMPVPIANVGLRPQAFKAPVPHPHPHINRAMVAARPTGSESRWANPRSIRTLLLLALGGIGLFIGGIGVGIYNVKPGNHEFQNVAARSATHALASTETQHSQAEVSGSRQSSVVDSQQPQPESRSPTDDGLATSKETSPTPTASNDAMVDVTVLNIGSGQQSALAQPTLETPASVGPSAVSPEVVAAPVTSPPVTSDVPSQSVAPFEPITLPLTVDTEQAPPAVGTPAEALPMENQTNSPPSNEKPVTRASTAKSSQQIKKAKEVILYGLSLMELRDPNSVLQVFIALQNRHAVLANKKPIVLSVERGGQTWYKLLVGPAMSENEARATCTAMGSEGQTLGCTAVAFADSQDKSATATGLQSQP